MNLPIKLALLQRGILWSSAPPPRAEGGPFAYFVEAYPSQVTPLLRRPLSLITLDSPLSRVKRTCRLGQGMSPSADPKAAADLNKRQGDSYPGVSASALTRPMAARRG